LLTEGSDRLNRGASPLNGVRVLVVEDSWHVARAMQSVLEQMGMVVASPVATLDDAKRLIAENTFDLALVDINLKGEMTYDLIGHLHDRGVRVVVVSGYAAVGESLLNAAAVLQKPFSGSELLATLRQVMRPT
jgi:DNA-binding response OmpR family regulator